MSFRHFAPLLLFLAGAAACADTRRAPGEAGAPASCEKESGPSSPESLRWCDGGDCVDVTSETVSTCLRSYTLRSTVSLRDHLPANPRVVAERPLLPRLRTGSLLFDALYTLALTEMEESSAATLEDGLMNGGRPVSCSPEGCFQAGRLWPYVWTRDTAFAAYLGLAAVAPERAARSLEFRLSERREGGGVEIMQDIASCGSYPAATDRVSWALGAASVLANLDGEERAAFRDATLAGLRNTIERDRVVVFDEASGLYRGETSFLDWGPQSYPEWTATDLGMFSLSKATSTNALHYAALRLASDLAQELGEDELSARYQSWAEALRAAMQQLWLEEDGLYASFTGNDLDPAPAHRFDLLGEALVVLLDLASESQAQAILAHYPHTSAGPPAIWPQQRGVDVYHSGAVWPFATAMWLLAAKKTGNDAVVTLATRSLMRAAALNLSNMENLDLATGAAAVLRDGRVMPVFNSSRQLWSIGGYLAMVQRVLFGLEPGSDGVRVSPYLTRDLRAELFGDSRELELSNYRYRGKRLDVIVRLPPLGPERVGAYAVGAITLDGRPVAGGALSATMLGEVSRLEVELVDDSASPSPSTMTYVAPPVPPLTYFGPLTPRLLSAERVDGHVRITFAPSADGDLIARTLYRDGTRVAEGLAGTAATWEDAAANPDEPHWYSAEAVGPEGMSHAHRAEVLWYVPAPERVQSFLPTDFVTNAGRVVDGNGRLHLEDWGAPADTIAIPSFVPRASGRHLLWVTAANGTPASGISCGIKRLVIEAIDTGEVVADTMVRVAASGSWAAWSRTGFTRLTLDATRAYRLRIEESTESKNMTAFADYAIYEGVGGRSGPFNRIDVAEIALLPLAAP